MTLTQILLVTFGGLAFALLLALCTWGAAQAGAGREFYRLSALDELDVIDAFHAELLERCDRTLEHDFTLAGVA